MGVAALVRAALFLDVQLDIEILGIGRSGLDRKDSCTLEAVGKHLAYWLILDGGFVFLRTQVVDSWSRITVMSTLPSLPNLEMVMSK